MNHKLSLITLTTIISILTALTMNSDFANSQNPPERVRPDRNERTLIIKALLPPSEAVEYVVLQPEQKITGRLGLPAAQLVDLPSELTEEIAVWVPPKVTAKELKSQDIAYQLNSSVRYRGNGHTAVVATYRLSPGANKLQQAFSNVERLSDGTEVGIATADRSNLPNRVVFKRGNSIIVIGSDLPIEQVKNLAVNAALK